MCVFVWRKHENRPRKVTDFFFPQQDTDLTCFIADCFQQNLLFSFGKNPVKIVIYIISGRHEKEEKKKKDPAELLSM